MPSQKPRIALTVPSEIDATLNKLSDLTNTPKTKIIIEMLEEYMPILDQVIDALEQIHKDKENGKEIAKKFAQDILFNGNEALGIIAKEAKEL